MQQIPLSKVPSQDLSINLDGVYWRINLHLSMQFVCATIVRDGETLISSVRCFVDQPLLPYPYMYEPNFGNFLFDSDVDWENFDGSCSLYYLNSEEFKQYLAIKKAGYEASAIKNLRIRDAKFAASKINIPSGFPTTTPEITVPLQPITQTVQEGQPAGFTITAKNWAQMYLEFSPTSSGSAWKIISTASHSGDTSSGVAASFEISSTIKQNQGYYRAVVIGDGNAVTSAQAYLGVE
jgi:hypothetical protein